MFLRGLLRDQGSPEVQPSLRWWRVAWAQRGQRSAPGGPSSRLVLSLSTDSFLSQGMHLE